MFIDVVTAFIFNRASQWDEYNEPADVNNRPWQCDSSNLWWIFEFEYLEDNCDNIFVFAFVQMWRQGKERRREWVGDRQRQESAHKNTSRERERRLSILVIAMLLLSTLLLLQMFTVYKFSNECGMGTMLRWDLHLNRIHSIHSCFVKRITHTCFICFVLKDMSMFLCLQCTRYYL